MKVDILGIQVTQVIQALVDLVVRMGNLDILGKMVNQDLVGKMDSLDSLAILENKV